VKSGLFTSTAPWVLTGLLLGAALFSDFLAANPPDQQNLERFFAPPTRIHFFDRNGTFHWRPFVYDYRLVDPLDARYAQDSAQAHSLRFFVPGYSYRLFGAIPCSVHLMGTDVTQTFYPFGADELGRDVLARALAGAQTSLLVVLLGTVIFVALGSVSGILAGLAGGWCDGLLMRAADLVLALPALYVILALRALLPANLPPWKGVFLATGTIAAVTWPPLARGTRGLILQLRGAAFIEAARSFGGSHRWILTHHLLPALFPYLLQQVLVCAPVFLLGEIVLSFLDVGIGGSISWGSMLRNLTDPRILTDFWWNLLPLIFVFLALFALNLAGSRRGRERPVRTVL
jgi:peptide/nickel transport system permease protein